MHVPVIDERDQQVMQTLVKAVAQKELTHGADSMITVGNEAKLVD